MRLKFEESIITTIVILINILVFGVPEVNFVKLILGSTALWIFCYLIMSFEIKEGDTNE